MTLRALRHIKKFISLLLSRQNGGLIISGYKNPWVIIRPMPKNRNLVILFFTLVVVMLGFGMIIPILPFLVQRYGGGGFAMGMLMAIFSLMQFIFSPIWGNLSDRYGRKPILLLGALGNALTNVGFGFSTNLWTLYLFRALGGVLSSATLPTAMAFIGDRTEEDERGGGMGIVGAAMGVGMVLGPGIGGLLGGGTLQTPFFLAAGLSLAAALLIWTFLPESLPIEKRTISGNQFQGLQFGGMWKALFGPLGYLFILAFLHNFAMTNFEGIYAYYAEERYGYGPNTIGLILTVTGLVSALVQGVLTGIATRTWGDVPIIKVSLFASIFGFSLMLTAKSLPVVILTTSLFILSNAMLRPSVSSLISKRAITGQGAAMGLNNAFMSLGRIIGPLWAGNALDMNLSLPFMTGAVIMLSGFLTSLLYLKDNSPAREAVSAD
jgi:DHA1 family multidrug resistance protein-like MFS transporter